MNVHAGGNATPFDSRESDQTVSPRVRRLLAAAIKYVVSAKLGWRLSDLEALALAEVGDVDTAIERLREKSRVRRAIVGAPASAAAQRLVAIAEVVADHQGLHAGDVAARADYIRSLLEEHRRGDKQAQDTAERAGRLDELINEIASQSKQMRQFLRRVSDLRSIQQNRLRVAIADPERRRASLSRLDAIYQSHLTGLKTVDL